MGCPHQSSFFRKVGWKRIEDRYKKLQDSFDRHDACDRVLSGVRGQIRELDDLLVPIGEARKDFDVQKSASNAGRDGREA